MINSSPVVEVDLSVLTLPSPTRSGGKDRGMRVSRLRTGNTEEREEELYSLKYRRFYSDVRTYYLYDDNKSGLRVLHFWSSVQTQY